LLQSVSESLPNSCIIDCLECVTMTVLYERILSHCGKRAAPKLCSTITDFVTRFNAALDRKLVLLLDEVERLIQVDSNAFSVLLRLPEMVAASSTVFVYSLCSV
jgi:Cdc6-like AAA superfamily ATPase